MHTTWEELRDRQWELELTRNVQTETIGHPIIAFREVGSTNDVAKRFAEERAPDGLVVIARNQTVGRGRRERKWISFPDRAVYLSAILRPPLTSEQASWLGVLGAVSVADALGALGLSNAQIKWPNDIMVNGRKIAGILVEPRMGEERLEFAVVGVGVNIAQQHSDWPEDLRDIATSCLIERLEVSIERAIQTILERMDYWYARLQARAIEDIMAKWRAWGGTDRLPALD